MSYEAGSKECRHLIEAKESLLSTLDALSNIHATDLIQIQIKEIYNELEQMHDNRKKIESATNYLETYSINKNFQKWLFIFFTLFSDNKSNKASS